MQHFRTSTITKSLVLFASLLVAMSGTALAVTIPTSQFDLTGLVNRPGTFDYNALVNLPSPNPVTQVDSFTAGGNPTTVTFTGVPLYNFLTMPQGGNGIPTPLGAKNELLGDAVVVTGSDGYRSIVSEGEIDPNFGNKQDLVAYQNAAGVPLNTNPATNGDGFARTTAPGDVAGGRYVSNVAQISVFSGAANSQISAIGPTGTISNNITVGGQISNPGNPGQPFTLSQLNLMPQTPLATGGNTYGGVSLWTFLQNAGLVSPTGKNPTLQQYVIVTGSDGYKVLVSLGEINPMFGNQLDLIATTLNGGSLGTDGLFRLIVPGDSRHGRWVSNIIGLEVFTAPVPVPAAVWLVGSGLVGLAGIARRTQRAVSPHR